MPTFTPKNTLSLPAMPIAVKRAALAISTHELIFLTLAAPFLLFPGRWTLAAFGLILFVWPCRWLATGRLTTRTPLDLPILLLGLMAAIGTVVSVDPSMSQAKLWGLVLQAALFFALVNGLRDERSLKRMALVFVGLTTAVASLALFGTDWSAVRLLDLPWVYNRLPSLVRGLPGSGVPRASTLFHPREVGAALAMLLPIPAALLFFGLDRRLRLLSALAVAAGAVVLLLTQSLSALLGLGIALLVIAVWRSRWFLLALPLGLLATAGVMWAYGPARAARALLSLDHPIGVGVVLRLDIWSRALAMVQDMPYTGIGLNTFPIIQTQFYPGVLLGPEPHAHSLFLQTALDLGLPGLLALVWLLVAFFLLLPRAYHATSSRDLSVALVGIGAGVAAYLGNGLVDAVTLGAKPVAALFAMLAFVIAALRVGRQGSDAADREMPGPQAPALAADHSRSRRWGRVLPAALIVAVLSLNWLIFPSRAGLNVAVIRGHQFLIGAPPPGEAPGGDLQTALNALERTTRPGAASAASYELLGSLYARQGDFADATSSLDRAVAIDAEASIGRHAPWLSAQRRLLGTAPPDIWQDLISVYTQWLVRYPDRAENYLRPALIYDRHLGDVARARAVLQSGLEHGAEPAGLLAQYLARLN